MQTYVQLLTEKFSKTCLCAESQNHKVNPSNNKSDSSLLVSYKQQNQLQAQKTANASLRWKYHVVYEVAAIATNCSHGYRSATEQRSVSTRLLPDHFPSIDLQRKHPKTMAQHLTEFNVFTLTFSLMEYHIHNY